jgi:F-type H+-transporting ATPase subunit delta
MEGVSRESYAAAVDRLAAFSSEQEPDRIDGVADEILAVADLLRREPRLRRALADPAREPSDRAGLVESVLTGKVSGDAVELLKVLVAGRWGTPGQLLDATERFGVEALLSAAERGNELADVEDELFRFGQVVDGDNQLASALGDSSQAVSRRGELVRELLDGKVEPATLRLAQLALQGFGGRGFSASLSRLVEVVATKREETIAYVTTAVPLTDAEEEQLTQRLSRLYGRSISPKVDVDPRIIGGMRVKIGSDLYDGSVARRLAEARTALTR